MQVASASSTMLSLDPDAFLKLFLTQVRHQDPTQPLDPSQMMSSLAQLTTVQKLQQVNDSFTQSLRTENLRLAQELIGSQVTYGVPGNQSTGVVQAAEVQSGQVGVIVGGQFVKIDSISGIMPAAQK